MRLIYPLLIVLLMFSTACQGSPAQSSAREALTRKPLAGFDISVAADRREVIAALTAYAVRRGFAIRVDPLGSPDEKELFDITLFRSDLMINVASPFKSSDLSVGVYPLCSCELEHRPSLPADAKEVSQELRQLLSSIPAK